ncbi:hypothetical protein ACFRDV_22210 [Streptomyces fagopyri]|uniref:hypothetical protein n=1 Tax=Streptomyces fagopyri TaxID=2662397 RepID=UPI0036854FE8
MIAAIAAVFASSGGAQASSSGWFSPDANATTQDTPAEAEFNGHHVVVNRGDGDNALWFDHDNGPFSRIGGTTFTAPAMTVFNDQLYLFQTGQDGNVYYQVMGLNAADQPTWAWSSSHRISAPSGTGVRVTLRPAIASSGDQLHIIVVGNNEHIYHSALYTNNSWSGSWTEVPGGGRTESGPTATTTPDGYLVVEHRGTNNLMYQQQGNVGTGVWAGSWTQLPHGQTNSAPAISYNGADGRIVEAWRDAGTGVIQTSESSRWTVDQTNPVNTPGNLTSPSGPSASYDDGNGVTLGIRGANFTNIDGDYHENHIYLHYHIYGR